MNDIERKRQEQEMEEGVGTQRRFIVQKLRNKIRKI